MDDVEQSKRVPYPYPQVENDVTRGSTIDESFQGVLHQKDTSHIKCNPGERLHATATLSSLRHSAGFYEPQAPRDQLDFALKGQYDHHGEMQKTRAETLYQKETLNLPHTRVLKNRFKEPEPIDPSKREVVTHRDKKMLTEYSIKGAISGHHTTETNQGYSRKTDGGFYTC